MQANRACHDGDRWIEADPERSLRSYQRAAVLDPGTEDELKAYFGPDGSESG